MGLLCGSCLNFRLCEFGLNFWGLCGVWGFCAWFEFIVVRVF